MLKAPSVMAKRLPLCSRGLEPADYFMAVVWAAGSSPLTDAIMRTQALGCGLNQGWNHGYQALVPLRDACFFCAHFA